MLLKKLLRLDRLSNLNSSLPNVGLSWSSSITNDFDPLNIFNWNGYIFANFLFLIIW